MNYHNENKNITQTSDSRETLFAASKFTKERDYWLNKLSGELPKSSFPYDQKRTRANQRKMATVEFVLNRELFSKLMKLSRGSDPNIHMILMAALVLLMNRYTGSKDIILGAPIYKQERETEFTNTVLPLRNQLPDNISFKELLLLIRQTITEAVENQSYPVEQLLDKLNLPVSHNGDFPLFDTAILLENIHDKKYLHHTNPNMIFTFIRKDDTVKGVLEFNSFLYKKTTIERIIRHFIQVSKNVLRDIDLKISHVDILTGEDKKQLLFDFNHTQQDYPKNKTIQELFEQQVAKTPGNIAVSGTESGVSSITYNLLNQRANQLEMVLRKSGVTPESVVGIMMERSPETAAALLAILKAGGAYLPILTHFPEERVLFMLEDSSARVVLVGPQGEEKIPFTSLRGFANNPHIQVQVTPPRQPIKYFDQLPVPDRSLMDLRNYKNKIGMASVTNCISLQTTRGCPYECLFCHKLWSKKHVHRSAENIYHEIQYYYNNGIRNFAVIDDCFNLFHENSRQLFRLIIKNKLQLQLFFPNGLRGDIMTPDYIDLMVESGTRGINLSLETGSPRLQRLIKKNLDLDKFKKVVDYISGQHPGVMLEMATMHGFPTETREEAMMTLDFIKSIKWLHFPYIHILKVFPNTEMERFALANGVSKKDIMASQDMGFHELPETLPFPKSFTRQYQSDFMNEYFLNKERLKKVLPVQRNILSEEAIAQKYNAYLPVEITSVEDIIRFAQLEDMPPDPPPVNLKENKGERSQAALSFFDGQPPARPIKPGARKILFLDLSQHFSSHQMLYKVVEQPLGLVYLLSYLNQRFGDKIHGKVYKSGNDFDSFEELKVIIEGYQPDLIGIRTLTFFKEFFHETVSLIREWGIDVPIITGGPYASSDYETILKDKNIDLVVLGEGEATLGELIDRMLESPTKFQLPGEDVLPGIKGIAFIKNKHLASHDKSRAVIFPHKIPLPHASKPESVLNKKFLRGSRGQFFQKAPPYVSRSRRQSNLAYVMYTSGSTGKPKGVMVEHKQVNNCIYWMQDKFHLTPGDVVVQRTNLTFDPSVWEIFWPLYIGASVRVLNENQSKDADFLLRLLAGDGDLTMMYCPSTLVNAMLYLLEAKAEKPRLKLPWLIIGAEPISKEVVRNFYSYFEGKIVNTYGPTECTINNTYHDLYSDDGRPNVPIGKPVANNQIYILSQDLQLLPVKIPGEICIAGDGVARGYINHTEKTVESFINNPFGQGKLFKTGDIGRWMEDGTIEIMGRLDEQVKIRGYRIEPGEIEACLLMHPAINECLVMVKDSKKSEPEIKTCKTCGITSAYPNIIIDDEMVCNICQDYQRLKPSIDTYFQTPSHLWSRIEAVNKDRKGKYDCLLLYSGGRGAAYALYQLVEQGLKVLALTYNNGYFGKSHLENIRKITRQLGVDHVELTHKNSDHIMRESMKTISTVCRGCFHTSFSLAGEYAYRNNINVVIGATLSRGQIIENKLLMFFNVGITGVEELEEEILKMQKATPEIDKAIFDTIDIDVVTDGSIHHRVTFLDFYRYFDITNKEMIAYLNAKHPYWKTRKSFAIYSTNCPLKQIGDYGHLRERSYHYYGAATSWEKRLEHLTLANVKEDLQNHVTARGYENFSRRIDYQPKRENKLEKSGHFLCAYVVPDSSMSKESSLASQLKDYLSGQLPEYMVPSYFVPLEQMPLTSNGKIERKALLEVEWGAAANTGGYIAPRNQLEEQLAEVWSEVLEMDKNRISIDGNFFDLGGQSLKSTIMAAKIQQRLKVKLSLADIFQLPTIREMAAFLQELNPGTSAPIEPVEKREYYALSPAQSRLYVIHRLDPESTSYNMSNIVILEGELAGEKAGETFKQLVHRHESFRTSFELIDAQPVQRVRENMEFEIEYHDLKVSGALTHGDRCRWKYEGTRGLAPLSKEPAAGNSQPETTLISSFIRSFDLSKAPLLRIGLIKRDEQTHLLMVDMHHIISDGISLEVFIRDLINLYLGGRLPEPKLQYKDFSQWLNKGILRGEMKKQEEYWLKEFQGKPPVMNLPTDYPRPDNNNSEGDAIEFELAVEETAKLREWAKKENATMFMVVLAIFNTLLFKITNQKEIVIGTVISGREYPGVEDIIGFFVNTLALRYQTSGHQTFIQYLRQVRKKTLEAFENQDYQFEELVEKLMVQREPGRNPLFDVLFAFISQNVQRMLSSKTIPEISQSDLNVRPYGGEGSLPSKFDITFASTDFGDNISFAIQYRTQLYKKETIERFIEYFKDIVSTVTKDEEVRLQDIKISYDLGIAASKIYQHQEIEFEF